VTVAEPAALPTNLLPISVGGDLQVNDDLLPRVLLAPFRTGADHTVAPDRDLLTAEPVARLRAGRQVVSYRLSPRAVWSDGQPITVRDFEFTWRLQRDRGCPDLANADGYDQIESVRGTGGTVEVTFRRPYADWRALFQLYPQHLMDTGGPLCAVVRRGWPVAGGLPADVASGPWQITRARIEPGRQITLTPNPRWWGAPPRLASIKVTGMADARAALAAVRDGEADVVQLRSPATLAGQLRDDPDLTVRTQADLALEHLDLNTRVPALADGRVRRAVALAVDRPALRSAEATGATGDTGGTGDTGATGSTWAGLPAKVLDNRFFVSGQPGYRDTSGGQYAHADPAAAGALLRQAGYRRSGRYFGKVGKRLFLVLSTPTGSPSRLLAAQRIAAQLERAGIAVRTQPTASLFLGPDQPGSLASGRWQLALYAWLGSPFIGGEVPVYRSGGPLNYGGGGDPRVDALLDRLSGTLDLAGQAELANAADTQLWRDMFSLPLYERPVTLVHRTELTGPQVSDSSIGPLWNCDQWSVR
jgi:peptide/nickel transport system substrate-binding protein